MEISVTQLVFTVLGGLMAGLILWQLRDLKADIRDVRANNERAVDSMRADIRDVRASNERAVDSLRTDLKTDIARLEARLSGGSATGGSDLTVSNP